MATSNVQVMAKRVKGGSFLTEERDPQDVFTPEDLSEEHRQIAKTAIDFTQNEVMPAAAEIEAKNFEVMAKRVKGGSFLTEERDPQDVFTPEALSEEPGQIAKPAIDFTQNEVKSIAVLAICRC